MLFVRKAVHAALLLAVVMIALAVLYAVLDAPFLFAVQIIVYTGAILMLFLFVLMLVGVDASDSLVETIRGQRLLADRRAACCFGSVLVIGAQPGRPSAPSVGLDDGQRRRQRRRASPTSCSPSTSSPSRSPARCSSPLPRRDGAGAPRAAHAEADQADLAAQRMRDYAESGKHPGPLPAPGVFARHNAVDTPALLPDGTASELSVIARARRPRHGPLGSGAGRRHRRRRVS